jgi:tight adherence protein C
MMVALATASWLAATALAAARWQLPTRVAGVAAHARSHRSRTRVRSAVRTVVVVTPVFVAAASIHVALGIITLLGPALIARWRALRAARVWSARVAAAMPELVDLVAAGIAAGCTARHAMLSSRRAAPGALHPALDRLAARLDRGERFADALGRLAGDLGEPARPLVSALRAHERDGVPLHPTLERIAADARRQRRQQAEAAIHRLPVRLSVPLVTCTLSAFVVLTVVPLGAATLRSLQREVPTHQEVSP